MNYTLRGHTRDNAVREVLICLLPDEAHHAVDEALEGEDGCLSAALCEDGRIRASAAVRRAGRTTEGVCEEQAPPEGGEPYKRALSYCVKTALYRALLPWSAPQPWGSLTGVKPAKPVRLALRDGLAGEQAAAWLHARYDVEPGRCELTVEAARCALAVERTLAPREAQVYVGIPFCPAKCSYCSFVSNDIGRWGHLIAPYYDSLLAEVEAAGAYARAAGRPIGSLYLGGGTPTTLSARQLDGLLGALTRAFSPAPGTELTVEAGRPETIDDEKLDVLRRHGVTRVSVNPQSMDDAVLRGVGRCHTARDIERAYGQARARGFVVNMDLIAGLPGDSEDGLFDSVRAVAALEPENITIHALARKRGARLAFGQTGELSPAALDRCRAWLGGRGYHPYYLYRQKYSAGGLENVGYCRGDTASRYNLCMMEELSDVLALGAGGVTKLCAEGGRRITRLTNPKYPREYIDSAPAIAARWRNLLAIPAGE